MELTESESPSIMAAKPSSSSSSSSSSSHHHHHRHHNLRHHHHHNLRHHHNPNHPYPSRLSIDLNEVPSHSETLLSPSSSNFIVLSPTSVVRSIHDNPRPPEGDAAEIPDDVSPCGGCGGASPASVSERLVCDGCERGFHFGCAGVSPVMVEEWVSGFCAAEGFPVNGGGLGCRRREVLGLLI